MIPKRFILVVRRSMANRQKQSEGRLRSRPEESWSFCVTIGCCLVVNPFRRLKVPT